MIANPSFFFGVRQISNGRLESAALTFPDRKFHIFLKKVLLYPFFNFYRRFRCMKCTLHGNMAGIKNGFRELEENNIRISRRFFVRIQGVMAGA